MYAIIANTFVIASVAFGKVIVEYLTKMNFVEA